jgi:hypothetical protein
MEGDVSNTADTVRSLILERPLCARCIAAKAATTEAEVDAVLTSLATGTRLRGRDHERCRSCGDVGRAFRLDARSDV